MHSESVQVDTIEKRRESIPKAKIVFTDAMQQTSFPSSSEGSRKSKKQPNGRNNKVMTDEYTTTKDLEQPKEEIIMVGKPD